METNINSRDFLQVFKKYFCLVIVIGMAFTAKLSAQTSCSLACKSEINVSVSEDDVVNGCSIMLSAEMILNGSATSCPSAGTYVGTITFADGTSLSDDLPFLWDNAHDYTHQKLSFSITDPVSKNTCWGHINVEDKLPPIIVAEGPVIDVVSCCDDNLYVDPGTSPHFGMTGSGICAMTGSGVFVEECSDIEWIVLSQVSIQNPCNGTVCPDFSRVIERKLIAKDAWGLTSEDTLTQHIKVKRVDITENLICPPDFINGDALTCETLPMDVVTLEGVSIPAPTEKGGGLPTLIKKDGPDEGTDPDTIPLYPLNAGDSLTLAVFQNCNIGVRHEDRLIPKVGKGSCGGYTLVRNWIINEWACPTAGGAGEVVDTCTQVFELIDNDGPVLLESVNRFEGTTNGYTCEGNVFVPAPIFEDKCSGVERIDVTYPGGFIEGFSPNGGFIELPLGTDTVVFVAYDACHNISDPDTVIVDVWDKTPPVVICDEHVVVSLADKGRTSVPARTFDDGSYDDCGIMEIYARRMDENRGCSVPEYSTFSHLGEYEGSHYYLSNRPFKRSLAFNKATAMGAGVFDFEGGSTSAERTYVVSQLPVTLDPATVIMAPNSVGKGRYILEVQDLCSVFRENIDFDCDDPETQMIVLRACDHQGNYNDCMFEVELQNKIPPKIINCPVDIKISCGVNFVVDEPSMSSIFGTIVSEAELVKTYHFIGDDRGIDANGDGVLEPHEEEFFATGIGSQPDTLCDGTDAVPFEIWDGIYWDNCGGATVSIENIDKRDKCGLGYIDRVFTLHDSNGDKVESCTQTVKVKQIKQFDFNTIDLPADTSILACGLPEAYGPEVTGFPEIVEGQCDLVGFNYTDQVFLFNEYDENNPACFKIIRTWQFIDWCSFEGDDTQPYPMPPHEQIIKVTDNDAPEILFSCEERSECTYDPDCESGYIELLKTAIDGCTGSDHLRWQAEVFIDIKAEENVVDTIFTGVGNLANASAHYPVGKHMVTWKFWDRCGNIVKCNQIFVIKNCKAAAPYCIDGLVVDLMPVDTDGDGEPDDGMVELWASDFDLGSTHPCGYPVILSFSEDIHETNRTFDCRHERRTIDVRVYSSVIIGEGAHADTVQSFCITTLQVQDNNRACRGRLDGGGDEDGALISGLIHTENNRSLESAEVHLEGSELAPSMTDANGLYAFSEMPLGGNYLVAPNKNDDHMNGVSTLDLVMIQKHILGLELLDGPFKKIAADINKDQNITASDLVELRKLILGNIDAFESNNSWRFVDDGYEFINDNNPLNELFAEDYDIPTLSENMDIDFTAIKVGDVNNSVALANYSLTEVRSSNALKLIARSKQVGDQVRIPITTSELQSLSGIQFTIEYDINNLAYQGIESGVFELSDNNVGLKNADRGLVTFSWNSSEINQYKSSDVLITLVFNGQSENLSSKIRIGSAVTAAEAYTTDNEIMDVSLDLDDTSALLSGYSLDQNTPNPFKDATAITFSLPRAMNAKVSIHDVTGKLVRQYNGNYDAGINSIQISRSDLQVNGVLYYTLTAGEFSATKRMVILD